MGTQDEQSAGADGVSGMEGAPGHQAAALTVSDLPARSDGWATTARGAYRNEGARTLGGFDR